MRDRPWKVGVLIVLLAGTLAWYLGLPAALEEGITRLAGQPSVRSAFRDPESGRGDALTALIAFSVLTPIAAFALAIIVVLVVKAFETLLGSLRLPGWLSAPVVAMVAIFTMYATSSSWVPASLHGLGLIARAYLVYSYGPLPVFR